MRILVIGATTIKTSDVSLLLANAFDRKGHHTRILSTSENSVFWVDVARQLPSSSIDKIAFSRKVLSVIRSWKPDLLFIIGSNFWILPKYLRKIKIENLCSIALWELNQQNLVYGYQTDSIKYYDFVFALDSYMLPIFKVAGVKNVYHLPACADVREHNKALLTESDIDRYGSDICFIGSVNKKRIKVLKLLKNYDLKIYGSGWIRNESGLGDYVIDEPVYGYKKTKVYSASKITINAHGPHMIYGENFRVFEASASKSVCFSEYQPDLVKMFEAGEEVVIFKTENDLLNKAQYYLNNEDVLRKVGEKAQNKVFSQHTYDHRVDEILERINKNI